MPRPFHSTPRPTTAYIIPNYPPSPNSRHEEEDDNRTARNAILYPQKRNPLQFNGNMPYDDYVDTCLNNIEAEIWALTATQLKDYDKLPKFTVSLREENPSHRVIIREISGRPSDLPPEAYVEPRDFHNTACICLSRLGILRWNESKNRLSIQLGCEIYGASTLPSKPSKTTKSAGPGRYYCQVFLMGFVGSYMKDIKASIRAQERRYLLLESIADSNRLMPFNYQKATITEDTPMTIKINSRQLQCLRGLKSNVEGIQGPPGTGKSTTIFHLLNSFVPADYLAIVTCVQNKAVDSIAEKLAGHIPFLVFGNEDRLGETAKKYLLQEQVERHKDVRSQRKVVDECDLAYEEAIMVYDEICEEMDELGEPSRSLIDGVYDLMKGMRRLNIAGAGLLQDELDAAITQKNEAEIALNKATNKLIQIIRRVELEIAKDARAVLCTIDSTCALFPKELEHIFSHKPKIAIIDEAGTVPEYKTPLLAVLGCEAIVCIGDQKQLYPFSHFGETKQGLFHRLASTIHVPMLNVQHRMHPSICKYVSETFYAGELKTFPDLSREGGGLTWVPHTTPEVREKPSGFSNPQEVRLVIDALKSVPASQSVMVITFYKKQLYALIDAVRILDERENLRITTVDASQGSEADVVIISCVRSNSGKDIGFLKDSNRLCVATSRARFRLIVIGNKHTLSSNGQWKALVKACS